MWNFVAGFMVGITLVQSKYLALAWLRDIGCVLDIAWRTLLGRIYFFRPIIINPTSAKTPIVLVHGSSGNQSEWTHAIHDIEQTFLGHPIYAFSLDIPYDANTGEQTGGHLLKTTFDVKRLARKHNWTIQQYADELALRIKHLPNVILIGHSMGGLIAAEYQQKYPDHVKNVVAFSAPFQGAPLLKYRLFQWLACSQKHEQMRPNSDYLVTLNEKIKNHNTYLTVGSPQDWQVPDAYARIPGVMHVCTNGYNHFSIVNSQYAWQRVYNFIYT